MALSRYKKSFAQQKTRSGMWGDNTNGPSSTGLLRSTDSSSAIRRNIAMVLNLLTLRVRSYYLQLIIGINCREYKIHIKTRAVFVQAAIMYFKICGVSRKYKFKSYFLVSQTPSPQFMYIGKNELEILLNLNQKQKQLLKSRWTPTCSRNLKPCTAGRLK